MPTKLRKTPSYRLHKPTDQAVVRLDGHDHYLGRYGTEASQEAYRRLLAEWLTTRTPRTGGPGPPPAADGTSVNEVILAFWTRHAETHYRHPGGRPTGELANFRDSLKPLKHLYGETPASEFSPLKLKAVRKAMIDSGLSRSTINQRVGRIVHLFKWATENELVPPSVHHGLKAVQGLQRGRSEAKEAQPVTPVRNDLIDLVRQRIARQVSAMIDLQLLTGMRPGEVTIMRTCDLDTSGEVWTYTPSSHKTAHHGRHRVIYLGPRAQEVVKPWLRSNPSEYLFSPKEAMEEFRSQQRRNRKTPLYPSQKARTRKSNPKQKPGERYTTRSYCHAVGYGCKRAGIPNWHPHQLRHNAATNLRKEFGIEVARVILGHTSPLVTEVYAEIDRDKAIAVMGRVG